MTSCSNVKENISAYLDNELSIKDRLSFEKHIESCKQCKVELDKIAHIAALCAELPQRELPPDFKAKLHEKLIESAQGQESNLRRIRKPKGFMFTKAFATIAAGMLLFFLAGSFYKYGLFPSMKKADDSTRNFSMAAEQREAAITGDLGYDGAKDNAGIADKEIKSFSTSAPAKGGELEVDRSSAIQNRETAFSGAEVMQKDETADSKLVTITITADEPELQAEKVKMLAATMSAKANDTATKVDMDFIIPEEQYEQFLEALNTSFGEANVQIGAFETEDMTDTLNSNITKSVEYDNKIQELQKKDSEKTTDEIKELKEKKEAIDIQIEEIRLGTDFINVKVFINRR